MAIVTGMLLGIKEHGRIQHIDLKGSAAVLSIAFEKGDEFVFMFRIPDHGRVKGHGVAGTVGQEIDISVEVTLIVVRFSAKDLSHGVGVGCWPVDVCPV